MDRLAVNATDIVGSAEGPFDVSYTSRDLLLYALGIGATELRYLHEDYPHFCAFPTYPLVLPYKGTSSDVVHFPGRTLFLIPQALRHVVNPGAILHYDQSIDIFAPLDPGGAELESRSVVLGAYRRRGGVLLRTKTTLTAKNGGRTIAETTQGTFMRGLQILGDVGPPLPPRPQPPPDAPDVVATVTVLPHQAFLYRLSGDYNPIHVDPEAARKAGLDRPILHGLCSLGIAARQIVRHFCPDSDDGTSSLELLSLYCRFSRTVLPGDVLEVKMWGPAAPRVVSTSSSSGSSSAGGGGGDESDNSVNVHSAASCVGMARTVATGESAAAAAPRRGGGGGSTTKVFHDEKQEKQEQQQQQQQHETSPMRPSGPKEDIRFEVCSPRQGGAVVVADGRAVVQRRRSAPEQTGRQSSRMDSTHRARL